MTVTYEPPLTTSRAQTGEALTREVITEGPAYIRGSRSTRWHRIRSAYAALSDRTSIGGDLDLVRHWHHWCGTYSWAHDGDDRKVWLTDTPPIDEPRCGTCEGRAIGADRARPEWLFSPHRLEAPRQCPGSRTMLVAEDQGRWNRATCLVCGDVVKLSAGGGPYNPTYGAQAHEPGPGLVDGCAFHAWRDLVLATTSTGTQVLVCRCTTQEARSA